MGFLEKLARNLVSDCDLAPGARLVLGVSGGVDSMVLMAALDRLAYSPMVAHLDHGLRPDSPHDADLVEQEAGRRGLPHFSSRTDVSAMAQETGLNLEDAARQTRYEFLFSLAREEGADFVAVAHHADDQVETILMHLIRGAGPAGFSGMKFLALPNPWSEEIALLRPLLAIKRSEIHAWAEENQIAYREDESNQNTELLRNALRHEIIPAIEQHNPSFKAGLLRSQSVFTTENEVLEALTEEAWTRCVMAGDGRVLRFSRVLWAEQPLALQRRLGRKAFEQLGADSSKLDFAAVEGFLDWLMSARHNARLDWVAGIQVLVEGDQLIFQVGQESKTEGPQMDKPLAIAVSGAMSIRVNEGWILLIESSGENGVHQGSTEDIYSILCDLSAFKDLQLRPRQVGDRFQPLGMREGSMKLSDYMINVKLPKRARAAWPLLAAGSQILWVPGFQLAESIRVRPESKDLVQLSLKKNGD